MTEIFYKTVIENKTDPYDEKYIIVEKKGQGYYFVSYPLSYHSMIMNRFQSQEDCSSKELFVRGGGIVQINQSKQLIKTWGQSGSYGKPDRDLVELILTKNYPDFELKVTVTDYIRG